MQWRNRAKEPIEATRLAEWRQRPRGFDAPRSRAMEIAPAERAPLAIANAMRDCAPPRCDTARHDGDSAVRAVRQCGEAAVPGDRMTRDGEAHAGNCGPGCRSRAGCAAHHDRPADRLRSLRE